LSPLCLIALPVNIGVQRDTLRNTRQVSRVT